MKLVLEGGMVVKSAMKIWIGILLVVMLAGPRAEAAAQWKLFDYVPAAMASVDTAISTIRDMRGFIYTVNDYPIRELSIDTAGLRVLGIAEGLRNSKDYVCTPPSSLNCSWQIVKVPYRYEENAVLDFKSLRSLSLYVPAASSPDAHPYLVYFDNTIFRTASLDATRRFADAVFTLAVAQGASFPACGFTTYNSALEVNKKIILDIYKKNKVSSGAIVYYFLENGSELLQDDIIIEAADGEKISPVPNENSWIMIYQEAVAGKPEITLTVKVVRNGVVMSKNVRIVNHGFGATVSQSGQTSSQGSGTPPKGFGLTLRLLEGAEAQTIGLPNASCFLVLSVEKNSAAEKLQIKSSDVLLALNGVDITSATQLQELVRGPVTSARVFRAGAVVTLQAPLTI